MQILPTSITDISSSSSNAQSDRDTLGFSRLLSQYMEGSPAEVTPVYDSNPHAVVGSESDMFTTKAPYIEHSANGSSSQEIRFTKAEVQKIAAGLQKEGMDPAVINAVLDLADNPTGVTTPEIMQAIVNAVRKPAQVTDGDLSRISAFLNQIDPEDTISAGVMEDLLAGRTHQAWDRIVSALNALDPSTQLDVDADDVTALGRTLGLSDATLDALRKSFGGASSLKLTPNGFQNLMTPGQQELGDSQKQMEKLAECFDKVLSPIAQEARMRLAAEASANGRAARSVDQSIILIQDTVTRNGLARQSVQTTTSSEGARQSAQENSGTPVEMAKAQAAASAANSKASADAKSGEESLLSDNSGKKDAQQSLTGNAEQKTSEAGKSSRAAWDSLLSRVSYQEQAPIPSSSMSLATSQAAVLPQAPATLPNYAPQVLNQVEQGMLTAMRNGGQKLELQLAPEHLGAVTVVLTSKNGEINALLRVEKPETAAVVNQQTDQLKYALEQQGLKVDKVEVQTQLQDHRTNMHWQGMDQHNSSQEHQSQAQAREQQRIMRIGRLHRGGSSDMGMERNMHNSMHGVRDAAEVAGRGLHIIT